MVVCINSVSAVLGFFEPGSVMSRHEVCVLMCDGDVHKVLLVINSSFSKLTTFPFCTEEWIFLLSEENFTVTLLT